ncbi:hypothetical protein BDF22DRAFT_689462 [Syncephalis plumigaleata]|nr:hypothetical protein BDF22DRAFT_689462 [Syncephalis plumigaleata]
MEKFSRWRDAGTGIQPFLHPMPARSDNWSIALHNGVKQYLVGPILFVVRSVLLLVTALLWLVAELLGVILCILPGGRHLARYYLVGGCARLALFIIGVFWIDTSIVSLRLGRDQSDDRRARPSKSIQLSHGDILVVNSTGYLDILYLMARWTPVFTRIYHDRVEVVTFWQALRQTANATPLATTQNTPTTLYSLEELVRKVKVKRLGPIIIQPEATTSNGRALLQFSPVFRHFDPSLTDSQIRIATFKYPYHHYCPTYSFGSQWRHFFNLCCQYYTPMMIRYLSPQKCPTTASTSASADNTNDNDPLGEEIAVLMGQMSRLRRTQLGVQDKYEFLQFYKQRNEGRVRRR